MFSVDTFILQKITAFIFHFTKRFKLIPCLLTKKTKKKKITQYHGINYLVIISTNNKLFISVSKTILIFTLKLYSKTCTVEPNQSILILMIFEKCKCKIYVILTCNAHHNSLAIIQFFKYLRLTHLIKIAFYFVKSVEIRASDSLTHINPDIVIKCQGFPRLPILPARTNSPDAYVDSTTRLATFRFFDLIDPLRQLDAKTCQRQ